jgi:hypothetical protein
MHERDSRRRKDNAPKSKLMAGLNRNAVNAGTEARGLCA